MCNEQRTPQTLSIRSDRTKVAGDLGGAAAFSCAQSWRERFRSGKAKILCAGHVPLSERSRPARGTSRRVHRHRYHCSVQTTPWLQRLASNGLGCIWSAGGAIRCQDRPAPCCHDAAERGEIQKPIKTDRFFLRLATGDQHHRPSLLQMDAVDFSPNLQLVVQSTDKTSRADFNVSRKSRRQRSTRLCC